MQKNDTTRTYAVDPIEINFVLQLTGVRDGYEDFRRSLPPRDWHMNEEFVTRYEMGRLVAAELRATGRPLPRWPMVEPPISILSFVVTRRALGHKFVPQAA